MPVEDGMGHGELTALKSEHYARIIAMHLAVTQAVLDKHRYYRQRYRYTDLTAGKGYAPDGTKGSPILFLEAVSDAGFHHTYRADFIEKEANNVEELERNLLTTAGQENKLSDVHFHLGCYENIIPSLLPTGNDHEFGLVFVDPTGQKPDFETLKYISKMRSKMEILIYVSTTNIKRVYHLTEMLLSDYMKQVGKAHWLIRKPISWDSHKWTFLLGSRTDIFKDYKSIDFLRLDSEEAQSFFPKLNLSAKQRMKKWQPRLL